MYAINEICILKRIYLAISSFSSCFFFPYAPLGVSIVLRYARRNYYDHPSITIT